MVCSSLVLQSTAHLPECLSVEQRGQPHAPFRPEGTGESAATILVRTYSYDRFDISAGKKNTSFPCMVLRYVGTESCLQMNRNALHIRLVGRPGPSNVLRKNFGSKSAYPFPRVTLLR